MNHSQQKENIPLSNNALLNYWASCFTDYQKLHEQPEEAFRILLVAGLTSLIAATMFSLAIFHLLWTNNAQVAIWNLMGTALNLFWLITLHKTKKIGWLGQYILISFMTFLFIFTAMTQGQNYSLIWLLFVPFAAIPLLGRKLGLYSLAIFYGFIFTYIYFGIGKWDQGAFDALSLARVFIGSMISTALVLIVEWVSTGLNTKIKHLRATERRYTDELRRLSTTDALTEVYNRHYLKEVFENKVNALSRSNQTLVFFIVDIDHFKTYNDTFGHQKGDQVLQQVAKTIRSHIKRREDLVFRLGGEEFAGIVVSESDFKSIQDTVEWLKELVPIIEALGIPHSPDAPRKYVTISMGVYSTRVKVGDSIDKLYITADKALYQAKTQGRNQVVIKNS